MWECLKFHHPGKGEGEPGTADFIWELSGNSRCCFQPWIFFFFLFWRLTGFQILVPIQLVGRNSPELQYSLACCPVPLSTWSCSCLVGTTKRDFSDNAGVHVCVHSFTYLGEAGEEGDGKGNWSRHFSQSRTEGHCQFISKSLFRISEITFYPF